MSKSVLMLSDSAGNWGRAGFKQVLKREVEQLDHQLLPLQEGLSVSSAVSPEPFQVMVINTVEQDDLIKSKIGIFYRGIIAGCNCADDPTPLESENEYCEMTVLINRMSGVASVHLHGLDSE